MRREEIAIVGGGQAGLALSYHLTQRNRAHVLLEQARALESWRTKRWDSLRLIAPNWTLIMPDYAYPGDDPDGFMGKDEVVDRLMGYAASFGAPVQEGIRVTSVARDPSDSAFVLETSNGPIQADQVVLATGSLQRPNLPPYAGAIPDSIGQLPGSNYRNPGALAPGGVLIVGSGETGAQISEELARAGRVVYLSGGRSWWSPRRYRGRDVTYWMRPLGWFERRVDELPPGVRAGLPNPQLTGADGGHDISPHSLARQGVRLLGRLRGIEDGVAHFGSGLREDLAWADDLAAKRLEAIDTLIEAEQLDAPATEWPAELAPAQTRSATAAEEQAARPTTELDLAKAGVGTVIWAAGYRPDLDWVRLSFLDEDGYPIQRRGVTNVPGLSIIGLDWLHNAKSGLFAGVGDDAAFLAEAITAPS
jgi:putative flavoprotein involved in K+ transport